MSGPRRSVAPVRQLSLQQPVPRRQHIRRQRSAEDEKSLQIYTNPIARGKLGASIKAGPDRPKVRLAWSENRRKNEKQIGDVEVVARQIPGRSRPTTGRSSRSFVTAEKAPILYSRQELAERLRLAWKHREENKANIDIFLAHGTLEERCDSELSSLVTITAPSTPLPKKETIKSDKLLELKLRQNDQVPTSIEPICSNEYCTEIQDKEIPEKMLIVLKNNESCNLQKHDKVELSINVESSVHDTKDIEINKPHFRENVEEKDESNSEVEEEEVQEETDNVLVESDVHNQTIESKKRTINVDCINAHMQSSVLPTIKSENNTTGLVRIQKEETSLAKQKRACFHSGTNRAFLGPLKSSTECKYNLVTEKSVSQKITEIKSNSTIEKTSVRTVLDGKDSFTNEKTTIVKSTSELGYNLTTEKSTLQKQTTEIKSNLILEKNLRSKTVIENTDLSLSDKPFPGKNITENKCNLTTEKFAYQKKVETKSSSLSEKNVLASLCTENKDNLTSDKTTIVKNSSDRSTILKKASEIQKIDQKSKRTSSAPPQRHLGNVTSNNRLQVNIVIDTPNTSESVEKSGVCDTQNTQEADATTAVVRRTDCPTSKLLSTRSVRSAPLKRRSKSAKRRLFGGSTCKDDDDGKPKNRSGNRGRNSIDSRTIDLVTMVSLVSSADSDSEAENSPGDDKLINELRSKLPTTSIIKTSINSALSTMRKPVKSVSFQRGSSCEEDPPKEQQVPVKEEKRTSQSRFASIDNRGNTGNLSSNEETLPWRTDTPGLALPVLALIHDVEETLDVPLTDREKRCLAVPIGDLHDKKRKLLRTRSTPSRPSINRPIVPMETKEQKSPVILPRPESSTQQTKITPDVPSPKICLDKIEQVSTTPTKEVDQEMRTPSSEPQFQTSKEKECWHLYRKMCDKGVYVSFDTVLRGMLTPTEYRLRQKELMQDL